MVPVDVDGVRTREIIRLVVDFLTEPRLGFVSCCPRRKIKGRFGLRFWLVRLVTGAQDCHGVAVEVEVGLDVPLKEIREGDKGETILSRTQGAALI